MKASTQSISRAGPRALVAGLIGTISMLLCASSASALEFARHISDSDTVNAVEVKGKVEPGDATALRAYIAKLPAKPTTAVYLNSMGGSLDATGNLPCNALT